MRKDLTMFLFNNLTGFGKFLAPIEFLGNFSWEYLKM